MAFKKAISQPADNGDDLDGFSLFSSSCLVALRLSTIFPPATTVGQLETHNELSLLPPLLASAAHAPI